LELERNSKLTNPENNQSSKISQIRSVSVQKILLFSLFVLASLISVNEVYADHSEVTIVPAQGSGAPGCEEVQYGCYIPGIATVDLGGVVTFSNTDSAAHTFSAGTAADGPTGEFDTSMVMNGGSYKWTADVLGEIDYFCMVHPWMVGLIIVNEDNSNPTPSPSPTPPPVSYPPQNYSADITIERDTSSPGCERGNDCYDPYRFSTQVGNTVEWYNGDSAAHTVTSGTPSGGPDGNFDSSLFMAGGTFSVTLNTAGEYPYFCMIHPWMEGIVDVKEKPKPVITKPNPISTNTVYAADGSGAPGCEENFACYEPYAISVKTGTTVTFSNTDSAAHTFSSGTPADGPTSEFDSSMVMSGNSFSHTFNKSGTYDYFCMVHPWMEGTVQVYGVNIIETPIPTPPVTSTIDVYTDSSSYSPEDLVTIRVSTTDKENVAINVSDSNGNNIVTRTVTTDSSGNGTIQFKLPSSSKNGIYKVDATATVSGNKIFDNTTFSVKSPSSNITIVSLHPTDQQGNIISSFSKGKLGFVNVVLNSNSNVSSLVTINLFDSDLTSLGIGSFKTTLNQGQSEMLLSFFIPNDAEFGNADIYANVFSDWPSQGGVPLTGESSTKVKLQ
jgi:plastocyanin